MKRQLHIEDIHIEIQRKKIKNMYLRVRPPLGEVRVSAPLGMDLDSIRVFVRSKLKWIRKQQAKFEAQKREAPREFVDRENHFFRGERYLLRVIEREAPPKVELRHRTLTLQVRPGATTEKKQKILDEWYRAQLKKSLPALIEKWEQKMHVHVHEFGIKKMKTLWGSCNCTAKRIWLNLELAKKPPECLEYVLVHEMVHLLERKHNDRFFAYMNQFLPKWRIYKDKLNQFQD